VAANVISSSSTQVAASVAPVQATLFSAQDPKVYAAALIRENGGAIRPNFGVIVGRLEALQKNNDPAIKAFGVAVEEAVISQLSAGRQARVVQIQQSLTNATYTVGGQSFSRSGLTIEATREAAARAPNRNNPAYVQYMRFDRQHGDGRWATNNSAQINDAWASMIASGITDPAQYAQRSRAMQNALGSTIVQFQNEFSANTLQSTIGNSVVNGLSQSEQFASSPLAQTVRQLLTQGPQMQTAFQLGLIQGAAGNAWTMVTSLARLAGATVQFGADTGANGLLGMVGDSARTATPEWLKQAARSLGVDKILDPTIPSYTRGLETQRALQNVATNVKEYFATRSPTQIGQDILGALEKRWGALQSEFNALNGDRIQQAQWLGKQVGAVLFEVAATVVPITKLGSAARIAETTGDIARGLDNVGSIRYGALDNLGRPTGVKATITADMIGTGTPANPSIIPPGWSGNGTLFNEGRGHLLGRQLGGSGDLPQNLVTLQQTPANSPVMSGFEFMVRKAVETGEVVNYSSTPIYKGPNLPPRGITLRGIGSGGFDLNVTVLNPPGN
jgi:DNA/RNA non-specific endonuclease